MKIKCYAIYDDVNEQIISVIVGEYPLSWIFPNRETAEKVLFTAPIPNKGNCSVRQCELIIEDLIATEETNITREAIAETSDIETEITDITPEGEDDGQNDSGNSNDNNNPNGSV